VDIEATVTLIKDIGTLVASIDATVEYTKRSFCLFELYAAVSQHVAYFCEGVVKHIRDSLDKAPITSKNAIAQCPEDKIQIDKFIEDSIGFEEFDQKLTDALPER